MRIVNQRRVHYCLERAFHRDGRRRGWFWRPCWQGTHGVLSGDFIWIVVAEAYDRVIWREHAGIEETIVVVWSTTGVRSGDSRYPTPDGGVVAGVDPVQTCRLLRAFRTTLLCSCPERGEPVLEPSGIFHRAAREWRRESSEAHFGGIEDIWCLVRRLR